MDEQLKYALQVLRGNDTEKFIETLSKCCSEGSRYVAIEARYHLAKHYRERGNTADAIEHAIECFDQISALPAEVRNTPPFKLFGWKLDMEISIVAFYCPGREKLGLNACKRIIADADIIPREYQYIVVTTRQNYGYYSPFIGGEDEEETGREEYHIDTTVTVVSMYVDLAKYEHRRKNREIYKNPAQQFLRQRVPMVLFLDNTFIDEAREIRKECGLLKYTKIVEITWDDLCKATYLEKIEANCKTFKNDGGIANFNHDKDTPRYMVLNNSKYGFVERAISLNPFGSDQYAWVDFGIIGAVRDFGGFKEALDYSAQYYQLSIPYICPKLEHLSPEKFFGTNWFYCCAGYLQGHKDTWDKFISEFDALFAQIIERGYYGNEESFLGYLMVERLELFKPFYADYYNIFKNRPTLVADKSVAQMCMRETAGKPRLAYFHKDVKKRLSGE